MAGQPFPAPLGAALGHVTRLGCGTNNARGCDAVTRGRTLVPEPTAGPDPLSSVSTVSPDHRTPDKPRGSVRETGLCDATAPRRLGVPSTPGSPSAVTSLAHHWPVSVSRETGSHEATRLLTSGLQCDTEPARFRSLLNVTESFQPISKREITRQA